MNLKDAIVLNVQPSIESDETQTFFHKDTDYSNLFFSSNSFNDSSAN